MPKSDAFELGTRSGSLEAKMAALTFDGPVTWTAAHEWLNRAGSAEMEAIRLDQREAWEWGYRIMFTLKIRRQLD